MTVDEVVKAFPDQVGAVAEANRLSLEQAAFGIQMQEPAGAVWELARQSLDDFGGGWLEWSPSPVLAIGLVEADEADLELMRRWSAESGVPIEARRVPHLYADLVEVANSIDAALKPTKFVVLVDEQSSEVVLDGVVPEAQREIAVELGRGVGLRFDNPDGAIEPSTNVAGGWDAGSCTMAFAAVRPDGRRAITTAGHCDSLGTPLFPSSPAVTLSAESFAIPLAGPVDRQLHVIPTNHSSSNTLLTPGPVTITRGIMARLIQNSQFMFYGQRSNTSTAGGGCGRPAAMLMKVTGYIESTGNINFESVAQLTGGGDQPIAGDSGGPLWTLDAAIGMLSTASAFAGNTNLCDDTGTGQAVRMDAQLMGTGFSLQEGLGGSFPTFGGVGLYHPITSTRVLDTRSGAPLSTLTTYPVNLSAALPGGGVGVSAVVINVVAIAQSGSGWTTAYPSFPSGFSLPTDTSLVNWSTAEPLRSGSGTLRVGDSNQITFRQSGTGTVHMIVDVIGYYGRANGVSPTGAGSRFVPRQPNRLYDSRPGSGGTGPLTPGETRFVAVAGGTTGVPLNARAVAVNVVGIQPTVQTYLTAFPAGQPVPGTSSVNVAPGDVVSRLVVEDVGAFGGLWVNNASGNVNIAVDLVGYFIDPMSTSSNGRSIFSGQRRVFDETMAANQTRVLDIVGPDRQVGPVDSVRAVHGNLTVASPTHNGWLTLSSAAFGASNLTSDLVFNPGELESNAVLLATDADGRIRITNNSPGTARVILDITGWVD